MWDWILFYNKQEKFFLSKIFPQNSLIVQFDATMTQSNPSSQSGQERLWHLIDSIYFYCLLATNSSILWHICFSFPGFPLYFLIFVVFTENCIALSQSDLRNFFMYVIMSMDKLDCVLCSHPILLCHAYDYRQNWTSLSSIDIIKWLIMHTFLCLNIF